MTENPETHAGCGFQADSQNEDLLKILVLDEFSKISIATTSFSQKSSCFQKQVKPKLGVACRGFRWSTTYRQNRLGARRHCQVFGRWGLAACSSYRRTRRSPSSAWHRAAASHRLGVGVAVQSKAWDCCRWLAAPQRR